MFLIPRVVASLASLCSKDSIQYALTGVHVKSLSGDRAQVTVTDGKCLARVVAKTPPPEDFPQVPNFTPNGENEEVIIDAKEFKKYVKQSGKKSPIPALAYAAVNSGKDGVTIATTDLAQGCVTALRPIEGKFPDVNAVIPSGKAEYTIYFNAELLASVLKEAAKYSPEANCVVRLDFRKPTGAATVITKNGDGEEFTGVIMPLDPKSAKAMF